MRLIVSILFMAALLAIQSPLHASSETIAAEVRDRLTISEIFDQVNLEPGPIDNRYFLPIGDHGPAQHELYATMVFSETEDPAWKIWRFPGAAVKVYRDGDRLVPIERDIVLADNDLSRWNLIFSPGRVWSEPGDNGFSRASFPFVLTNRTWNDAHNGVATFLFDDEVVSPLVFQITQETAPQNKFDAWGRLSILLKRGVPEDQPPATKDNSAELERRLPVRPLEDLAADYGQAGGQALRYWPVTRNESVSGLVVDGVVYVKNCQTRFGPYPYCDEMRHGVYSVTKSLGALVAMLRLAQKYGDGVFDLEVAAYLDISASHNGWDSVTFGDVLNMATGIGDEPTGTTHPFEDNIWSLYGKFMRRPSASDKLSVAFESGDYPWAPGERFRYRSMDTFVLAAAMDAYLKSKEGPGANIWDMVIEEVLRPIGVFHAPMMHTIEADGSRGIPILGEGIFPTYDDIVRVALLLQNAGRYREQQLLSAPKTREALYQTGIRGLPFPPESRFDGYSYHMSLWRLPIDLDDCTIVVPKMSGYGGNSVLLLPSGAIAFYLQDGREQIDQQLALAAHAVRSECQ